MAAHSSLRWQLYVAKPALKPDWDIIDGPCKKPNKGDEQAIKIGISHNAEGRCRAFGKGSTLKYVCTLHSEGAALHAEAILRAALIVRGWEKMNRMKDHFMVPKSMIKAFIKDAVEIMDECKIILSQTEIAVNNLIYRKSAD